jgi:hypothetical protein
VEDSVLALVEERHLVPVWLWVWTVAGLWWK